jgi:HSP20 family protein
MATEATTTDTQKPKTPTVPTVPEQTRSGVVYSPAVDIFENDSSITLLADMPGVKASDLDIDLRDNVLTLTGRVAPAATSKTIDQPKIDAQLTDGVLRLELPKVEKARPRQIIVRSL